MVRPASHSRADAAGKIIRRVDSFVTGGASPSSRSRSMVRSEHRQSRASSRFVRNSLLAPSCIHPLRSLLPHARLAAEDRLKTPKRREWYLIRDACSLTLYSRQHDRIAKHLGVFRNVTCGGTQAESTTFRSKYLCALFFSCTPVEPQ